jgi:pimeloyl-ACP methyl ester carboxylesterase
MPEPVATENSTNVRSRIPPQVRLIRASLGALQAVAPPLAAAWGEVIFRTPRRFPTPARERDWLTAANRLEVRAGEDRLPVWSWGDGPAVVLVHGWEGRGGQMGALGVGLAEAGLRAVAFDAPGHGEARSRLSSLPQLAAGVTAVAGAVGPVRAVVGHSFGAAAACWAVARGLAVDRLVLLAPPFDLDPYVVQFAGLLGASPVTVAAMVGRIERRFDVDWQEVRRPVLAAAARAPQTKVLVVHDREDDETPWSGGARVARSWPRGELVTTHGLGHRRLLRDPGVLERVAAFAAA